MVEMFVSSKNKEINLFGVNVPLIFHRISSSRNLITISSDSA
jgi:hypothetical protein